MGRDIHRKRNRPQTAFGLPPAAGVSDMDSVRASLQAIHDNLGDLVARIVALENAAVAEPDAIEEKKSDWPQLGGRTGGSGTVLGNDVDIENMSGSGLHKHRGFYLAASFGALPTPDTVENPMIGCVDDGVTCTYYKWDTVEEEWVEITGGGDFELVTAASKAALPASYEPAIGYVTDTKDYYVRKNSAWELDQILYTATTKANLTAASDGKLGYATTTDRLYARCNGAWICISHLEAS